jgi:hypothetical protein
MLQLGATGIEEEEEEYLKFLSPIFIILRLLSLF